MSIHFGVLICIVSAVLTSCSASHHMPKSSEQDHLVNNTWDVNQSDIENQIPLESRIVQLEDELARLKLDLVQTEQKASPLRPSPPVSKKTKPQKRGVRFGVHEGKTRIVLDLPQSVEFSTDLDNTEKFLLIELKGVDLNLKREGQGLKSSLISSYTVDTSTQGLTHIILTLKSNASIITQESLKPVGPYGHRIFIDLKES